MKIVAAFHARNWMKHLRRKLDNLRFCDKVVVVLDRPSKEEIEAARAYPNVQLVEFEGGAGVPDLINGEEHCAEGLMRQIAWDFAAKYEPDWILLGDADETFEDGDSGIQTFMRDFAKPDVDVYYLPMAHIVPGAAVTGNLRSDLSSIDCYLVCGHQSVWSFESPLNNRKGVICRWRPGVEYKYDLTKTRHTRMEPNPLNPFRAVEDDTHIRLRRPVLLHWKFYDWDAWLAHPQSAKEKYKNYWKPEAQEFCALPESWLTKTCICGEQLRPSWTSCEAQGIVPVWRCPKHPSLFLKGGAS